MSEKEESDLDKFYRFVYICKCGREYGSDEEEENEHLCPICRGELKIKT